MAYDKLVDSTQLDADLTSVANAIRTKGGTSASLAFPSDFVTAIGAIQTGGNYTTKTVDAGDYDQIVTANTEIRTYKPGYPVGARTAGNYQGVTRSLDPNTALTDNSEYILIGNVQVIDSNGYILEKYNVNTTVIWSTTKQNIIINDANAYYEKFTFKKSSTTTVTTTCYYQKTATYGYRAIFYICEKGSYDALSSVVVNRTPYSETLIKKFIERLSFDTFEFPSGLTKIGNGVFYGCSGLKYISIPETVTIIDDHAFDGCSSLVMDHLPSSLTRINTYAFYNCQALELTSLPSSVTSIGTYAFSTCYKLALTSLPNITTIETYAFNNCRKLNITTLPSTVTKINNGAFQNCVTLTSISGNGVITLLSTGAFTGSSSYPMQLTSVSFPNMTNGTTALGTVFGSSTAANACQLLAFADLGKITSIATNAFANCYSLQTLVLRRTDAICSLANVSAFLNTPLRGYNSLTADVYVPNALISTYQTATNWSTLYNNGTVTFKKIEGSAYELS